MNHTMWTTRFGAVTVAVVTAVASAGGWWAATSPSREPDLVVLTDQPALAASTDFEISIWGFTFGTPGGTANAVSTFGNIAMAFGDNANAVATDGFGNFASATGDLSTADAGGPDPTGIFNFASAFGESADAIAGGIGAPGSFNFASAIGDNVGAGAGGNLVAGLFNFAIALGNLFAPTVTYASANDGLGNLAFVLDLFGVLGSGAEAGSAGDFNLAGAFGDGLGALSTGGDFIWHILPFF